MTETTPTPTPSVTVPTAILKKAFIASGKIAKPKNEVPAWQSVMLTVTADGLIVDATDAESWRRQVIPSDSVDLPDDPDVPRSIVVDCRTAKTTLPKRVKASDRSTVTIDDHMLRVRTRTSTASVVRSCTPDEVPEVPEVRTLPIGPDGIASFYWTSADSLTDQLRAVVKASSNEESRFQLSAVYFDVDPDSGMLTTVATDGHRLHSAESAPSVTVTDPDHHDLLTGSTGEQIMVGTSAVKAILTDPGFKAVGRGKARRTPPVYMTATAHHVQIDTPTVSWIVRRVEGCFPDYARVVKTKAPNVTIDVDVDHLTDCLAAVGHAVPKTGRAVRIDVSHHADGVDEAFGDPAVTIHARDGEDEATAGLNGSTTRSGQFPIERGGERPTSIGVNPDYLTDAARALGSDRVRIQMVDPDNIVKLLPIGDVDLRTAAVVMPVRI